MSIILKRLAIGSFTKGYECPPDTIGSFKIYGLKIEGRNTTYDDIAKLGKTDREHARNSFVKLNKNAATGMPFREIFEGSQYHPGHQFKYKGSNRVVMRLRLVGDIRIYIDYLPNNVVVCLHTIAKRENDLSDSEKSKLENIAKMIIDCSDAGLVTIEG